MALKSRSAAVTVATQTLYTCPENKTAIVEFAQVTNTTTGDVALTLSLVTASPVATYRLVRTQPVAAGATVGVVSGRLVLAENDLLTCESSAVGLDLIIAVDEIAEDVNLKTVGNNGSATANTVLYTCPASKAARVIHGQIASTRNTNVTPILYEGKTVSTVTTRREIIRAVIVPYAAIAGFSGSMAREALQFFDWTCPANAASITLSIQEEAA